MKRENKIKSTVNDLDSLYERLQGFLNENNVKLFFVF